MKTKMKKLKCFILAMASLLTISCSDSNNEPSAIQQPGKTDVPDSPGVQTDGEPIVFSAELEEQADTRANLGNTIVYGLSTPYHDGIESLSQLQDLGFGVYGFYTGQKTMSSAINIEDKEIVMLDQKVTCYDKTNNKWTYNPMRFWPGSMNYMSFFAYAPYDDFTPTIGDGTTYAKQTEGTMANTYTFLADKPVTAPTYDWDINNQVDVLWGMNKNTGLPYKDIHRSGSDNGTLNWKFKHALSRVKFSIYNYMNIFGAYDNVATGISDGDVTATIGGEINIKDSSASQYIGTGSNADLTGWYAFLHEYKGGIRQESLCHKFVYLGEESRRMIITDVSLSNVVTKAKLHFDNTDAWNPSWEWEPTDVQPFSFSSSSDILNSAIYKSSLGGVNLDNWDSQPSLDPYLEPLVDAGAGKEHYLLIVPREKSADESENIWITVKYKVISKYRLEGSYAWDTSSSYPPEPVHGGDFLLEGVSVPSGDSYEISAPLNIDFKPNHSYHVKIRMGEMMQLLFEVTDWDYIHDITVPSFE